MQLGKEVQNEGDAYSKMAKFIRKQGRNETSTMTFGRIVSAPPDIEMKVDHDDEVYDKGDIYVAERLTAHKRRADITGLVIASPMTANGLGPHTHKLESISLKDAEISYLDELEEGDRVLVEWDEDNMKFIILDRVVSYK